MSVKITAISIFLAILMTFMGFVPKMAQARNADVTDLPMTEEMADSLAIMEENLLVAGMNTMSLMTGIFNPGLDIVMDDLSDRQSAIALDATLNALSTVSYSGEPGSSGFDIDALIAATPDPTDTDGDGMPDTVEAILGTSPENTDTDFDELDDYYEVKNDLDPLNPDSNNDGLADYLEITSDNITYAGRDLDGDGTPNVWDADNDNDGVPDSMDISPFSKSTVNDNFNFSITSNGNHVYMDFQIRPGDIDHLRLPMQMWDWPEDDKALMQDLDDSEEDVQITPMLQLSMTYLPPQEELEEYGIVIAEHKIALKASNGKYVSADLAAQPGELAPAAGEIQRKEKFDYIDLGSGEIALKAWNGYYAAADLAAYPNEVVVVSDAIGSKESFRVEHQPDGTVALKASNGKYVGADLVAYPNQLSVTADTVGPKEKFEIVELGGKVYVPLTPADDYGTNSALDSSKWALKDWNGDYVSADLGGHPDEITSTASHIGYKEKFDIIELGNNIVALRSWNGNYVSADLAAYPGELRAVANSIKSKERYELIDQGDGQIALLAWNGCYVSSDLAEYPDKLMAIADHIGYKEIFDLTELEGEASSVPSSPQDYANIVMFQGRMFFPSPEYYTLADNNNIEASLVWIVRGSTDDIYLSPRNTQSTPRLGKSNDGGDTAIADIDKNGVPDLLLMGIDDPEGENKFKYMIGWNLDSAARPSGWSGIVTVRGIGSCTAGGGAAIGYINNNTEPDLILMGVDDPSDQNHFRYRVGWDLKTNGKASSWSDVIEVGGSVGVYSSGGGADIADINGNGTPDLLFMCIDDPADQNEFRYRIGWDLNADGTAASWSDIAHVNGVGSLNAGGGAAIADIDNNGSLDMVLMGIDDPKGNNEFRYRVGWDLDSSGTTDSWSARVPVTGIGNSTDGGGASIYDFDGNGTPELLFMGVDDPDNHNEFRYIIGRDACHAIALKASNNKYVSANLGDYPDKLAVTATEIDTKEAFAFIDLGEDRAALRAYNGKYVSAALGDSVELKCVADEILSKEVFEIINLGGNKIALKAWNDNYVSADLYAYQDILVATQDNILEKEEFYIINTNFPSVRDWSGIIYSFSLGNNSAGGGTAIADINGNGEQDLLFMSIDDDNDNNELRYFIGWDVSMSGSVEKWSDYGQLTGTGDLTEGGGAEIADIDGNGIPDLLLMAVDAPDGANEFRYRIGWNLNNEGEASSWSGTIEPHKSVGSLNAGGGAAIADINGNGQLDLVLMGIDDPDGPNEFRYIIGWDLGTDGKTSNWSDTIHVTGIGNSTAGGGAAIGDINDNGKLDLVFTGVDDPDGANEFRTRIGWDLDSNGIASRWSVPLKNVNIGSRHAGGGAAIADIDNNGKQELVLMAIDAPNGTNQFRYKVVQNIDEDTDECWVTLAKYYEDFQITGFSVEENYGSDVQLYYSSDVVQTASAYVVLRYEFLNSQNGLSQQLGKLAENNVSVSHLGGSYSHQDEAVKAIATELTQNALAALPEGNLPILFALEDTYADSSMDVFASDSSYELGNSYDIDLSTAEESTIKTLKMSWYDTSSDLLLDFDDIVDEVESWGGSEEEDEDTLKYLMVCQEGEIKLTKVGGIETITELPEKNETLQDIRTLSSGLRGLVLVPAVAYGFGFFMMAWNTKGVSLKAAGKAASNMYKLVRGIKVAPEGIKQLESVMGKSLGKGQISKFSKLCRAAKVLGIIGFLAGVGISFYAFYQIASQHGWSSFGIALGALYGGLMLFYLVATVLIAMIPIVGTVISALIIVSDLLTAIFTGSGWSEKAIEAIVDLVVDYRELSEVDLEILETSIDQKDYDDNGLDVGDRIEYSSIVVERVNRTSEGSWDDVVDSKITPHVRFGDSGDYDTGYYRNTISSSEHYNRSRTVTHEIGAWLEPNTAKINLKVPVKFWADYRVYYEQCADYWLWETCERKSSSGTQTINLDPLYFDIMPGDLASFLNWSAIRPVYPDGDTLDTTEETDLGSNGSSWDTDTDGLSDSYEVYFSKTSPVSADSDSDGINDGLEMHLGTSPNNSDSDGDSLDDGTEYAGWPVSFTHGDTFTMTAWSSPLLANNDGDEFSDDSEYARALNPRSSDSDGDGMMDSYEVFVLSNPLVYNSIPTAVDDEYAVYEDNELSVEAPGVLENDSGYGTMTAVLIADTANGTLTLDSDGSFVYLPGADFNGSDNFTYHASINSMESGDALVTITVNPVNDAPSFTGSCNQTIQEDDIPQVYMWATMISAGAADESAQELDFIVTNDNNELFTAQPAISANGTLTYTPAPDASGSANVTVQLHDNGGIENDGQDTSPEQYFTITVEPVNDPPVATDNDAATDEDTPVTIDVLGNDSDVDNDTLTVDAVTQGASGEVTINPDNTVTYTPAPDFYGGDSFTYTAIDAEGASDNATVTVAIAPVNDPPVAMDNDAATDEDTPVTIDVLASDSDVDNDTLTVDAVTQGASGEVTINPDNTVTYTPAPDFYGGDSFTYTAGDGDGGAATATVTVNVNPVNDPPVADTGGPYYGDEGSPVPFDGTASDVDGDTLAYSWDFGDGTAPVSGTLTPYHLYVDDGVYTVTLTVDDGEGGTTALSTTVAVNNLAPVVEAGPDDGSFSGAVYNLTATFTDAGVLDTHTALIDWGDGSPPEAGTVNEANGSGTVSGSHVYTSPADYPVTVTVTDDTDPNSYGSDATTVAVIPLNADIDFDPDTLNLTSNGNWVTVFIELPGGADVNAIDGSTVVLNGVVSAYLGKQGWAKAESNDGNITDHDGDGIMARMVKFNMDEVKAILTPGEEVVITVSGLAGEIAFGGTDTIRVIDEGGKGKDNDKDNGKDKDNGNGKGKNK